MKTTLEIQRRLTELGLYAGKPDGILGPKTKAAIRAFQRVHGLAADGIAGPKTLAELFPAPMPRRDQDRPARAPAAAVTWPRQKDCTAFFGPPGGALATAGKVTLPFAFRIAWNLNQRVSSFRCHRRVAGPLERIFSTAVQHYGEKQYRALGLDLFGGCYNLRKMRGGSSWSMHSWGIAVDLDPARNQLKWGRDRAELAKPAYEPFWKIVESAGAVSLGRTRNMDFMHFQFARL